MTSPELEKELAALEARGRDLAEGGSPPRGALPGLFRALRAAPRDQAAAALPALAGRLADWPLVEPTLALVRELGLAGEWSAALAQLAPPRWAVEAEVQALLRAGPDPGQLIRLFELLLAEAPEDPTPLALELGVEPLSRALLDLLRARLSARAEQRDRTSARLARGSIVAAARVLPDLKELQTLVAQLVVAETRRAGDGEPVLALEALEALALAPPAIAIRLLVGLERALVPLRKKRPLERTEQLLSAALAALGAGAPELADVTARTGGLEPDGVARVRLDGDEDARLSLDADGSVVVALPAGASPGERRAVEHAVDELKGARAELVRRLEAAMLGGRRWRLAPWRLVFLDHPLWRDLASRLVWRLGATCFELDPDGTARDLFGDPVDLSGDGEVGLVHPLELPGEELELWRERAWARGRASPLLQLFRPVASGAPEALARFHGREAYRDDLSGWAGLPLVGSPPWFVRREVCGVKLELELGDVPAPVAKALPKRKPARKSGDDDDDDEEPRRRREEKPRRPPQEAAPRVKLAATRATGDLAGPRATLALGELVRHLEALTDPLATPSDLWLREWQERRWKDPEGAWKEAVLRYRQGSPALVALRRGLLQELLRRAGLAGRLEDRFLIAGRFVLELGSGACHAGAPKDHLPAWKAAEEAAQGNEGQPPPSLPFEPEADPETARVVELGLGLARRAAQNAAGE